MRNYGLGQIRASAAFNQGATGAGITVAVVDTGIEFDQADLVGRISPNSTDIIIGRNLPSGSTSRHGTFVSGVIASNFNGFGTIGVAYQSTILSIRADISTCSDPDNDVCFSSGDLARSLDYAVANGARVINLSLGGGGPQGAAFEAALLRAVNAGVVIVAASGNDSEDNPKWPARYAVDPRFQGRVIAVGSSNAAEQLSGFSNRAGVAMSGTITAPGSDIITACDGTSCWRVNGTSFAAPHVSGALALLLQAFPNLTGAQAIEILLTTARDAGAPGTDIEFGRGLLDLERAFAPVGPTSSPMGNGHAVRITPEPGAFIGAAFGDALRGHDGLTTIAYDSFDRLFTIDMGSMYPTAARRSFQPETAEPTRHVAIEMAGPAGLAFAFRAGAPDRSAPEPIVRRISPFDAPWLGHEERAEMSMSVSFGDRLAFDAWSGRGGARAPFRTGVGDGFAALAQADRAVRAQSLFGRFLVSSELGLGDRYSPFRQREVEASTYARTGINFIGDNFTLGFNAGTLSERLGPLGTYMPSTSDFALPSETRFAAVGASFNLSPTRTLSLEYGAGRTEIEGRFLSLGEAAMTSSWRMGVTQDCGGLRLPGEFACRSMTLELSQPLRVERGTFVADLANVPDEYFDPVSFSRREFSAAPSGRQIDLGLRSLFRLPGGADLQLDTVYIHQENHRADARPGFAVMGSWRRTF
ncbi:MAG: S8 family peptidase [Brevundimonas sp.]|uniref:S8 family peptidase n=1 Tax=Brevundimonas sp. TaxID=1871086 RepID=UPI00391C7268